MGESDRAPGLGRKTDYPRVKTPTVLQMEAVECGAASLAMVLRYYGKYIPLEELRIECGVSRDGSKASNILRAARKLGLEAVGYRKDLEALVDVRFPAIIFWNFNHFVVLEGIVGGKVFLNDPASGRRVVPWEEFDLSYTGVILEFKLTEDFVPSGQKPSIRVQLGRRAKGSETVLAYVVIAGLLLIVPGLVIPAFSQFFVDKILINGMTGFFKPLVFAMLCMIVLKAALVWLQESSLLRFQTKLAVSSSAKFILHVFSLPAEFFQQRMPGEIASRIQSNDSVATLLSEKLALTFINLFSIVFFGALMFRYDAVLTLLCILVLCLNLLALKLVDERQKIGNQKIQAESGKLYGITVSGVSMLETIKASGCENDFFMQWSGQQAKVLREMQEVSALSQVTGSLPAFLTRMLTVLILSIGSLRVMNGNMTMGMLVAFQALMTSFVSPVSALMELGGELQAGMADMQRLDDVMLYGRAQRFRDDYAEGKGSDVDARLPHSSGSVSDALPSPVAEASDHLKLKGFVTLDNVRFGYSRLENPLIDSFGLSLSPGSRVALVGGSGSGKSTVAKLVSSLYSPWEGEIRYDGLLLSKIDKKRFSSSLAIVDQDIFLFAGTIKDNLTMWNPMIPEVDYVQAAKDACIHGEISSRPGGYMSRIDEGGLNFSGGQRQRLEIARALAGNPRILILDEATSALDPVTEKEVDENIRRRGCTCIIVAHRLSTIRDCDEIIVMDKGRIVQRGAHTELIKVDGPYKELIKTI